MIFCARAGRSRREPDSRDRGDTLRALGPFKSSADICASGAIEAHGVHAVSFAGHPEGHPQLGPRRRWRRSGKARLGTKVGRSRRSRFSICFESAPILAWLKELEAHDLGIPVHIGLAGPASPTTLAKFALRCGVGNSLRSVREHIGRFGRLLMDDGPDDVLRGLWTSPSIAKAPIAGLHFFPFGGLRKTRQWLHSFDALEWSRTVGGVVSSA